MRTLLKIIGGVLVCLVLLLMVLSITGFEPRDKIPGLWLKGNLVTTPVADWSFTDKYPTIKIQTRTWYLLPHSVTIVCFSHDGQLYLFSVYPFGTRRSWNDNVARDPHVRIKIGNQLYDRTLTLVTDPAEIAAALQARARKYPGDPMPANRTVHVFHVIG